MKTFCEGIYVIGGLAEACFGQLNGVILCHPNCKLNRWFVHETFNFLRLCLTSDETTGTVLYKARRRCKGNDGCSDGGAEGQHHSSRRTEVL